MTERIRLTMAQALVKFIDNQYLEVDGEEKKFVHGIFGIFGHGCVTGVGEALEFMDHNLTFYQGKNEQSMGLAAVAYAKQLKREAIIPCLSSIGPGATNMVTAAACATANRIPFLALPGDTFACRQPDPVLQQIELYNGIGQTVNDAFRAVSRYFDRIERPEQLMTALINAFRVLTDPAETGAVTIALPQDVEAEAYDYPSYFFKKRVWHQDRRVPTEGQLKRALDLIKQSEKPLLIVGGGARYSRAAEEIKQLAEQHLIPFAETQAGKGIIAWDHKMNLGGIGVTGTKASNVLAKEADLIIGVGTRFSDFTTSSKWLFKNPKVKFLTLNIAPFDAYKLDACAIIVDAKEGLKAINNSLGSYKACWGEKIAEEKKAWSEIVDKLGEDTENGLSQTAAVAAINRAAGKDGIVVCAAGSLPGDLQRMWRPGDPDTYHVEYGYSNMGYDLNGALGVKLAAPEQDVYAMVGDGGYLMLNSELYTMVQERQKIIICLFDNAGWGCIEDLQNNHGGNSYGTQFMARDLASGDLTAPHIAVDYALNAKSLGCEAYTVKSLSELNEALAKTKEATGPVLLDIKVNHGSMSDGFESWWRVGVAEVSNGKRVNEAYERMQAEIKKTRDY